MADTIVSVVAENIFGRCLRAAREHLGYIWSYKKNMDNLHQQAEKLELEISDKNHAVTVAEKDVQKIRDRVKSWQDQADKISKEATKIMEEHKEKGEKRCLMGLCPNLVLRYQFSKRACKQETEIDGAIREAEQIKEVSDRAIGLGKEISLSTQGAFSFESRELVLEDIMKTLQDRTKNMIGVYGLGGMGKTTLATQVAARAKEEKMFQDIVFAPVTQTVDLKIQLFIFGLDSIKTVWQNQHLCQVKEATATNSSTRNQINLKKESHEVFSFQNVRVVIIHECKSLKYVFPISVAQSFNKLEELRIWHCEELDTIIGDENYMKLPEEVVKAREQVATTFMFPKLVKLSLDKLPKVECFYPRRHTIKWPVLKALDVRHCDKVSALDFLTIPEKQGNHNQFVKVISELESLSITGKDMIKILRLYDGHIPQHLFRSLKELTISGFHGEATTFPSKFLSIIHNQLGTFGVYNCSFQEIFPYEGEGIDPCSNSDVLLPQLRHLSLQKLPELK